MRVSEAKTLQNLKSFSLLAGRGGLENIISKVGILDYELVYGLEGMFHQGDFVLTSFTAIRDDENAIESCIKLLVDSGVSALAIKNVFVKELSQNVIDYADKFDFPIFIFDKSIFYEDIIEDLLDALKHQGYIDIIESKLDTLFLNELQTQVMEKLTKEINPDFKTYQYIYYLKEISYINELSAVKIAQKYQRSRHQKLENSIFKYHDSLILVLSYDEPNKHVLNDRDYIFEILNIDCKSYYIGISEGNISNFDQTLKESKYTCKVCEIESENFKHYNDIGVYQLLMPYNDRWMKKYVDRILNPIKDYDGGKLMETALLYIDNHGDILNTANALYQHKNTIRYRIQKMKSLLNLTEDGVFYEQLSIAIKCYKLINM